MPPKLIVEIIGDTSNLEKALGRTQKKSSEFNRKLKVGAGVALGGFALGTKQAISAASDLGEQLSKTTQVFKGGSEAVVDFSKTTADSIGISQEAALEATGTFGNMLVPMGIARARAAAMSTRFVKLAGDMASFNNASPEDTLEALRSGLAGETEPLRKFGVFLNQARIQQEAAALGLGKHEGALTASEKALATYQIILKDTKDTQGDFARTSGSVANQQRIVAAQWTNMQASLGKALLPAMQALLQVTSRVVGIMSRHQTATKVLVVSLAALAASVFAVSGAWKVYTAVTRASTLANLAFGRSAGVAAAGANTARLSLIGKAGLVAAAGVAAFMVTRLILKVTGLDKKLASLGASAFDAAAKLGLVNDPTAQFKGKITPGPGAVAVLRRQAAKLEAQGLSPSAAADRLSALHPNFAKRDIQVAAGVFSDKPIVVQVHLDGKKVAQSTTKHQQVRRRRNPPQKRGVLPQGT